MEKHVRKLTKTSTHSLYVIIPKDILEKYKWREKQRVVIVDKGRGKIEISDYRSK
ncbi:MAG: hypothetical protein P4L62_01505 [Candidatus Pacebacteria bacterium]|nr:hypothetical protein [Candidatus Paceibacterota bacterium]MDR3583014.1 hypothetical protein [Candidatus Paceibacterota bacterium]